ncbi:hypothetical protein KW790_00700 [Candidatus Parcubacteria bacterium]|nr:hypothetical protein [Candidatus Parcubacteria bacterium]
MYSDMGSRRKYQERGFIGLVMVLIVSLVLLKYITGLSIMSLWAHGMETAHSVWDHIHPPLLNLWSRVTHIYDWATSTTSFKESNSN